MSAAARRIFRRKGSWRAFSLFSLLFLAGAPTTGAAEPPPTAQDCLACHSDRDLKRSAPGPGRPASVHVDAAALKASSHGSLECVACHQTATAPHEERLPPARCQACHTQPQREVGGSIHAVLGEEGERTGCVTCHGSHEIQRAAPRVDAVCATCHQAEAKETAASIHATARGVGERRLPTCSTCHTAHAVKSHRDPASPTSRAHIHETCATCHADPKVIAEERIARPRVIPLFEQSIHGRAIRQGRLQAATCSDCHRAHDIRRGTDPTSTIFKGNVAATCGQCHARVAGKFQTSVHGVAVSRGVFAAPTCTDCHGEHTITGTREPGSRVSPLTVSTTCATCHEATPMVEEFGLAARRGGTFFDSFHGLAVRGGSTVAANCASCHGTHNILPSSDPRSTIHGQNLPGTCGQCHPGVGAQLASARIHVAPGMGEHPLVALVRQIYLVIIFGTIGGMALHNGLDFLRRMREQWRIEMGGRAPHEAEVAPALAARLFERMTVNERIQHLLLLATFVILVITGFALKFPESWWVRPLVWVEGGYAIRAWTHRIAGTLLTVAGVYHLGYLLGTRRGRSQLRAMRPRWQDARDIWGLVGYNLGLRASRPRFHRFSYVEKIEYWAVVWGTFVMAVTGFLMWFQTAVLRRWPLWSIDLATVIHYYEAWLATLAIVVWHLYSVVFRPGVYPMSWVWISGKLTGKQMAEEHPAELEAILQAAAEDRSAGNSGIPASPVAPGQG